MRRPRLRLEDFPDDDDDELERLLQEEEKFPLKQIVGIGKLRKSVNKSAGSALVGTFPKTAPRDWKSSHDLAYSLGQTRKLKVAPLAVYYVAQKIIAEDSLREGYDFIENGKGKMVHFPPALCEKITARLLAVPLFPKDWVRFGAAAIILKKSAQSFYVLSAEIRSAHPEMFGECISGAGQIDDYCSREAMEMVRTIYEERSAPRDFISINRIYNRLANEGIDINKAKKYIAECLSAGRYHAINYLDYSGSPMIHYKNELFNELREKLRGGGVSVTAKL